MTRMFKSFLGATALVTAAHAFPAPLFGINLGEGDSSSQATTAVSQSTISQDLVRPAQFARAAYCPTAAVANWSCGTACDALGQNVKVLASGGDNGEIPQCTRVPCHLPVVALSRAPSC